MRTSFARSSLTPSYGLSGMAPVQANELRASSPVEDVTTVDRSRRTKGERGAW
jgi:hypothetical protein